jgi:hypothetical protein
MSNNFQRKKESKREQRSRKMTITSSVAMDLPPKSYPPVLDPFLPSGSGEKSHLFVRREERDAQSTVDHDEVEESSVQQRHQSLNSIPPALDEVCFSDCSDPVTSVFHDDSSSIDDYRSYNMEEDRSDLKLIEELKIVRSYLRPVRNTMKLSFSKGKRRSKRGPRRKRGSSLEREIRTAVLQTAATAAAESTVPPILVNSHNEEVDRKSAQYILSDLFQEAPPSVPEQTMGDYSQSLFEKDHVVSPSVEPPTTASNGLDFEELLKFVSIDTPLASNESKEGSLFEIDINKLELDDVANQFSVDEDPFQGLGELDDPFSWREINDSFTSKSLDELETNPEEQQSYHKPALGDYQDPELLEGQVSDQTWPEVGDFDNSSTESDGEPAMKGSSPKPSVAENESPAGEADVPDRRQEEPVDPFAVDDDAWMSFGGSDVFAPIAGLKTDKDGFPATEPEENAPISAPTSSSPNPSQPPSPIKNLLDPASDTKRSMSPERKGFSDKKMSKPGSPASVVDFRSNSKNIQPAMGQRMPWQNALPYAMRV